MVTINNEKVQQVAAFFSIASRLAVNCGKAVSEYAHISNMLPSGSSLTDDDKQWVVDRTGILICPKYIR